VSTDYDTADRLYFEPLTLEDVIEVIRREQSNGELLGVICQFGGQTPLKLAHALADAGIPILGTSAEVNVLAEPRSFVANDGRLDFDRLLHEFADFWRENGEILTSRKKGFSIPLDAWFRQRLCEPARALLPDGVLVSRGLLKAPAVREAVASQHSARLWLLLAAELWARHWLEPASPSLHEWFPPAESAP
jgi:hypothetical protein